MPTPTIRIAAVLATASCAHAAPDAYRDLVAAESPILWYRMGEPVGSVSVLNEGTLGPSHSANVFGGVTLGESSASGDTAASFDFAGTPYLESVGLAPSSMLGNPSFTAEAVVWVPETGGQTQLWPPFLHWGEGSTAREAYFSFQRGDNDRVFCGFYNGGLMSECLVRRGEWNHFVWVRDSNNGTNDAYTGSRLFVNGIEENLVLAAGLPNFAGPPDVVQTSFRVQRARDGYRHFDGLIDEVVLYDTLHTPEQIEARFDALDLVPPTLCPADINGSCGILDLTDVDLFIAGFLSQDPIADLDNSGFWDLTDIDLFIASFLAGCP
ncbi:MAG: LamG-like jellyroll fold domain-containing protein [Planctomycetota bacterium]